ncbi:MAG: hypothetical protein C0459_02405 [Chitinophaga sp.]|jgi:hypothetical protein|nr:hypothetical protein [Chitinophaga sp.]
MYQGILAVHSLLRWVILFLFIINIANSLVEADMPYTKKDKSWNLRLLIVVHLNLLTGLYQYFFGPKGFIYFTDKVNYPDIGYVMKTPELRFWAVEHILGMIIAVVIITLTRRIAKNDNLEPGPKNKKLAIMYTVALVIILACIPWPFRISGAEWFRGVGL